MFKVVMIHNDDHPIPAWVDEKFKAAGIDWAYHQCENRADLEKWASDADILWTQGTRYGLVVEENMDAFKKAVAVVKCGSGTDHIDHDACTKRGIMIVHSPEIATEPASDHCIAMLFAAVRQIARQDRLVRKGRWDPRDAMPVGHFTGAELGLIGFGRIGRAIAGKLSGFRMNVRVYDPLVAEDEVSAAGAAKVALDELLVKSQFVLVVCPLTRETRGLLAERELKSMRPDAVLVNCARAGIVDEPALIRALKEGWIKAAALDVLEKHPLEPGDEWLSVENVVFTPHLGGSRDDYPDGIFRDVVEDIISISQGRMPRWIANSGVVPRIELSPKEG